MKSQMTLPIAAVLFMLVGISNLYSQEPFTLPKWTTPEEQLLLPTYTPPDVVKWAMPFPADRSVPFRTMGEWEELQAVVITWTSFQAILANMVRELQQECKVIIVCTNPTNVQNYLNNQGIDPHFNITYLVAPFNTIWVRDYGPNPVYASDVDSLYLVDWIYDRPRPLDDAIPFQIGNLLNLPVMSMSTPPDDLVHTGGNFMADGLGTGFSSHLILTENGPNNKYGVSNHDEAAIDALMKKYMGIDTYIKMANLPFDGIHHIDMHMKLLDEQTLLVGEYPTGIADGPQIEANLQYVLSNFTTPFGTPFKVVRIPMPPDHLGRFPHQNGHYRTYTNSLIANRTVLVPTYEEQYDTTALRIYREAMPGYRIKGINCNQIIPSGGAIHCISKEIGVHDPLRIVHLPISGEVYAIEGVPVDAIIQHREGIDEAYIYYTSDTLAGFEFVVMTPDASQPGTWSGFIPWHEEGTQLFYYIEAIATNGKVQRRPMTAPEGHWHFVMPEQPVSTHQTTLSDIVFEAAFPNPASAITCIPVEFGSYRGPVVLELVDALGRVHPIAMGLAKEDAQKFFLHASDYPSGIYHLILTTENHRLAQRLVITR
jgi:agmatine deiminase